MMMVVRKGGIHVAEQYTNLEQNPQADKSHSVHNILLRCLNLLFAKTAVGHVPS